MALDHIDVGRRPASLFVGGTHGPQLPFRSRRQKAAAEVIGETDTTDHGIDMVTGAHRILGPFEQEHAAPLTDHQAIAAIARITGGNFRLLHRLFVQIERIMRINELTAVTEDVVDAARSTLVIGAT